MEELQVRRAEEMRRYTLDYQIEILNSWYKNFFCIDKGCHTALFKKIIFFPEIIQELLEKDMMLQYVMELIQKAPGQKYHG